MSEAIQIALVTAGVNAAVTYGIIKTNLSWLRRDVDELRELRNALAKKVLEA